MLKPILFVVLCLSLALGGCALLDQLTGAPTAVTQPDGSVVVTPGTPNPTIKVVEGAVSAIPGFGWLIALGLTAATSIYKSVRASQLATDKLTLQTAWQALKDNWDGVQSFADLEKLIDNAAPTSAIAKRISEEIDMLKAKGVI